MTKRRVGGILTALFVGAIAAIGSFAHLRDLSLAHGQTALISTLIPFSVDGLIVCATFAMTGTNRFWPRTGFWLGVAATVSGNVLSAPLEPVAVAVAVWPPLALLAVIEILAPSKLRFRRTGVEDDAKTEPEPQPDEPVKAPKPRPNARGTASRRRVAAALRQKPDGTVTQIAALAKVSESSARRYMPAPPTAEVSNGHRPIADAGVLEPAESPV